MKKILSIIIILLSTAPLFAQFHDFGFEKEFNIPVLKQDSSVLSMAWLGGLNSCQFNAIDLNFDGIKDLVVFDRTGNRLLTFINNGTTQNTYYTYAPEYEKYFPYVHDWIYMVDYNGDGKEDIFTYFVGGIPVYRHDSDPIDGIKFTKMVNMLNSLQYNNYINLYVSDVELPGIADVNGDGCPDILVFHILGSYLNLHTNMSMVKYGHCDSLEFERTHHCWGNFFESENSNNLTLNINCPYSKTESESDKEILHVGSTLLPIDLNGNGLSDLLIADTDFPNIIAAFNGGTLQEAHIDSQDIAFPSYDIPVELYSMPMASFLDVDNDGKKDLIFSPFDGNSMLTESKKSVWFYKDISTNNIPVYELQTKSFLQEDMIEVGTGAYPVLFDINGNGLMDLFVSNYGYRDTSYYQNGFLYSDFKSKIAYFKNMGTLNTPVFQLITDDFAQLSQLNTTALYPAFADLDGDGDIDMLIGENNGTLYFVENLAGIGQEPIFATPFANYQNIDVGRFSTPQLVDLNQNGKFDLLIGSRNGKIAYYENTGNITQPQFTLITDTLGGVNVTDYNTSNYGYSVPCFFKDSTGTYRLFVGSESGKIHYYKNITGNLSGSFDLEEVQLLNIYEGVRTGIAVYDINNDNFVDLIIGNFSGGLNFYAGTIPQPQNVPQIHINNYFNVSIYPNPAQDIVHFETSIPINEADFYIELYDIKGLLINKQAFSQSMSISHLKNGMYFIIIKNTSQYKHVTTHKKLIINR